MQITVHSRVNSSLGFGNAEAGSYDGRSCTTKCSTTRITEYPCYLQIEHSTRYLQCTAICWAVASQGVLQTYFYVLSPFCFDLLLNSTPRWTYKGKCWPYCKAAKLPKANNAEPYPASSCDNMKYVQSCKAPCKAGFSGETAAACRQSGRWQQRNTCKRTSCPTAPRAVLKSQSPWGDSCKVGVMQA